MTSKTRYIRFDYFRPYIVSSVGGKTKGKPFDFLSWMASMNKLELTQRTKGYQGEDVRADKLFIDENTGYGIVHISRLRATNIPSIINRIKEDMKSIALEEDEFIAEDISCLYDSSINVLMIQRNVHSLSPTGIADYISQFLEDENSHVELRPVIYKDAFKKGSNKSIYRTINLKTSDIQKNPRILSLSNPISRAMNELQDFQGYDIEITISTSRKKESKLNKDVVIDTLEEFENSIEGLSKAIIRSKQSEDSKVEVTDLLKGRIFSYLPFEMPKKMFLNPISVQTSMINEYNPRVGMKRTEILKNIR
jgi:DNA helicase IV